MHKPILLLKAMSTPDANAAAGKGWEKLKKLPAWEEKKVNKRHQKNAKQFIFDARNWNRSSNNAVAVLYSDWIM